MPKDNLLETTQNYPKGNSEGKIIPLKSFPDSRLTNETLEQMGKYSSRVSVIMKKWYNSIRYKLYRQAFTSFKKVIPLKTRLALKKSMPVYVIQRIWKKDDVETWPVPANAHEQGLAKYEYSLFSQNGEDGILRYLFGEIGYCSRFFVEIGFEVTECNSLRLMLKEKLSGLLIDGEERAVKKFNEAVRHMRINNVKAVARFLTADNLQTVITSAGVPEEIDLLSIDVDGNDYWFWERIDFLNPRIVMVEYNASLGPEVSLAVPYDPAFRRHQKHTSGFYCSASLTAFNKLAEKKGYSLVGCDSSGVNAFFIRKDCITLNIRQLIPQEAFRPHQMRLKRGFSQEMQFETIREMPYVTVD